MEGETSRLKTLRPKLELRSRTLGAISDFFRGRDYLAVETPIRIPAPAPEFNIEAISSAGWYLATSPEIHMKRLLAAGYSRIFQICKVFRDGERGRYHNPEFTMLEWYREGANYLDMVDETEELVKYVALKVLGVTEIKRGNYLLNLEPPWQRLTVQSAFEQFAGWLPGSDPDQNQFNMDLIERVEPMLDFSQPVVLLDYPASLASLARLKPEDPQVAERFEVYAGGLELANGFSELTDPEEQRKRFNDENEKRRIQDLPIYPIPEDFLASMVNLAPCSGVALGVDRLIMLLTDALSIEQVVTFTTDTA
jgi:lysyl-tRNA synthetase class 2